MINLSNVIHELRLSHMLYQDLYESVKDEKGKARAAAYMDGVCDGLNFAIGLLEKEVEVNDEKKDT